MKHKKQSLIVLLLCLCMVYAAACGNAGKYSGQDTAEDKNIHTVEDSTIQSALTLLTGDEFQGRLYGSEGNQAAMDYLSDKLNEYGYTAFADENFLVPFEAELPTISGTSLTISGDSEIALEEGRDYIYSVMLPMELAGTIPQTAGEEEAIEIETDSGVMLILEVSDNRIGNYGAVSGREPLKAVRLGLTREAMDTIRAHAGSRITFLCQGEMGPVTLKNVMGLLPGKDAKRAVVIGAHFDHMGKVGDRIYRGAVDNASGVAALLAASEELAGKSLDVDIVVAFWNAEEMGLVGSAAMIPLLEERYEDYCYINLDCVGMNGAGKALLTTNNNSYALCSLLEEKLQETGSSVEADLNASMNSDHVNFQNCGSVNLGQGDEIWQIIHTPGDLPDMVDKEELKLLASSIARLLEGSAEEVLNAAGEAGGGLDGGSIGLVLPEGNYQDMTWEEQLAYQQEIEKQLAYDEYFILPNGYERLAIYGRNGILFHSVEEAQAVYEGLDIAESIGAYQLAQIQIHSFVEPVDGEEKDGIVLKRTFSTEDIYYINLFYVKEGDYLSYTLEYDSKAVDLSGLYDEFVKLEDEEEAYFGFSEEGEEPVDYLKQTEDDCFNVSIGPVFQDENGYYSSVNNFSESEYNRERLLEAARLVEESSPIIQKNNK